MESQAQFGAGALIDGKFEILALLGEGSFGAVYEGRDCKVDRPVAIKVIEAREGFPIDTFQHEVAAFKRLEHPNAVRLYDFGWINESSAYIVMELVKGRRLDEVLAAEGPLAVHRVATIAVQILDALVEAHSLGIIHCDLKPENIILTHKGAREEFAKVLDFGIATLLDPLDPNKKKGFEQLVGTPGFMAPEQIRQGAIGPPTDLYALGLILFELITGFPAVEGDTVEEVLNHQLGTPLMIPRQLYDTDMGPILERATAKKLADRYRSALDMHDEIKLALSQGAASPSWGVIHISDFEGMVEKTPAPSLAVDPFDTSRSQDLLGMLPEIESSYATVSPDALFDSGETPAALTSSDAARSQRIQAIARSARQRKPKRAKKQREKPLKYANEEPKNAAPESSAPKPIPKKTGGIQAASQAFVHESEGAKVKLILIIAIALIGLGAGAFFLLKGNTPANTEETGNEAQIEKKDTPIDPVDVARMRSAGLTSILAGIPWKSVKTVKIITAPHSATVRQGQRLVCKKTPCVLAYSHDDRERTFKVELKGFESQDLIYQDFNDSEGSILLELEALP